MTYFPDIPRSYTALTESLACLLVCISVLSSKDWKQNSLKVCGIFMIQFLLQSLASTLPLFLWTLGMAINIVWMFLSIHCLGMTYSRSTVYLTAKAFIIAELVASITWHLYCLLIYQQPVDNFWTQALFLFISSTAAYFLIYLQDKKIPLEEVIKFVEQRDVTVAIFTTLSIFVLSNIGFILSDTRQFQDSTSIFILRTTVNLSGLFLLFTQESQQYDRYLRQELSSIHNMFQLQYKQYQAYRENKDILDRKVHDLKHQLNIIQQEVDIDKKEQYIEEMKVVIQALEAKIETGNPVLDTILSQKNHYCLQHGINFTCIVQGELLHFMNIMDISALFGNAIDNAIEAVEKIEQVEQRLITLKVAQHQQFIIIRLDNYDTSSINLSTGQLPETSKSNKEYHGFGLKSMQYIATKYGGNLLLNKENNWVQLKIILPIKHETPLDNAKTH